jgi:hypothetical protein
MSAAFHQTTGFRVWLAEWVQAIRARMCWFIGHRVTISRWHRSPHTVHTHWRDHTCNRCGAAWWERGYFDRRDEANWPGDAP